MAGVVLPVPRANLFDENGIDASCGALYDAGALEGIRQDSYLLQVEQAVRDGDLTPASIAGLRHLIKAQPWVLLSATIWQRI